MFSLCPSQINCTHHNLAICKVNYPGAQADIQEEHKVTDVVQNEPTTFGAVGFVSKWCTQEDWDGIVDVEQGHDAEPSKPHTPW